MPDLAGTKVWPQLPGGQRVRDTAPTACQAQLARQAWHAKHPPIIVGALYPLPTLPPKTLNPACSFHGTNTLVRSSNTDRALVSAQASVQSWLPKYDAEMLCTTSPGAALSLNVPSVPHRAVPK